MSSMCPLIRSPSIDQWMYSTDLFGPPTDSTNEDQDMMVTGIHWTKTRVHASVVVITYAHHGIM